MLLLPRLTAPLPKTPVFLPLLLHLLLLRPRTRPPSAAEAGGGRPAEVAFFPSSVASGGNVSGVAGSPGGHSFLPASSPRAAAGGGVAAAETRPQTQQRQAEREEEAAAGAVLKLRLGRGDETTQEAEPGGAGRDGKTEAQGQGEGDDGQRVSGTDWRALQHAGMQQQGDNTKQQQQQQHFPEAGAATTAEAVPTADGGGPVAAAEEKRGAGPAVAGPAGERSAAFLPPPAGEPEDSRETRRRPAAAARGQTQPVYRSFHELKTLGSAHLPLGTFRRTLAHMRYREFIRRHHGMFGTCTVSQCLLWFLGCEFLVITLGLMTCYEGPDKTLVRQFVDVDHISGKLCVYFFCSFGLTLVLLFKYAGPLMLRVSVQLSQLTCVFLLVTLVGLQIRQSVLNNPACSTAFYSTQLKTNGVIILNGLYSQLQLLFFIASMNIFFIAAPGSS
eukprot:XP_028343318.1 uncharacterized protein LOC114485713 [Physeter catodon]